jgi:hypothetical protein
MEENPSDQNPRRKWSDHEDFLKNPQPKNPREILEKSSKNPAAEQGLKEGHC